MKNSGLIIILILLFTGVLFAVVNGPFFSANAEVNLVFTRLEMPFGILLLIEAVVLIGAAVVVGLINRFHARKQIGALESELSKARKVAVDTYEREGVPGESEKKSLQHLEEVVLKENHEVAERVSDAEKHLSKEIQSESRR